MARQFYLTSGHTSQGGLDAVFADIIKQAKVISVNVLNVAFPSKDKRDEKARQYVGQFNRLGISAGIHDPTDDIDLTKKRLSRAEMLYLPGGDTEYMLRTLEESGLSESIKGFQGPVCGNSAGAYVLTPAYLRIGRGEPEIIPATGILPIHLKCHYNPKFDKDLRALSETREILALEDPSMVKYEGDVRGGVMHVSGNVWRFFMGEKQRVP